jgi:hypothetical protein
MSTHTHCLVASADLKSSAIASSRRQSLESCEKKNPVDMNIVPWSVTFGGSIPVLTTPVGHS